MKIKTLLVILSVSSIFLILGCSDKSDQPVVIKSYPVKNLDGFLTQEGVEVDRDVSSDGNGSIKIVAPEST
ncbi:MAG: hypothetical protein JSU85_15260, partial [Candidatus Zixiibacteriota bacterium]